MINKQDKNKQRVRRHLRIRNNISGTATMPRLSVYRSSKSIYAQIINDEKGETIVSANTLQADIKTQIESLSKKEQAALVGKIIAEKALSKGITHVVFDRGGYIYTGRVKELADGARSAGLVF